MRSLGGAPSGALVPAVTLEGRRAASVSRITHHSPQQHIEGHESRQTNMSSSLAASLLWPGHNLWPKGRVRQSRGRWMPARDVGRWVHTFTRQPCGRRRLEKRLHIRSPDDAPADRWPVHATELNNDHQVSPTQPMPRRVKEAPTNLGQAVPVESPASKVSAGTTS